MKLAILNAGADTAGCGIGLKRAFDRHASGWQARAICRSVPYLDYPTDIVWPIGTPMPDEVADIVYKADVIHVMDHEYALGNFVRKWLRRKRIVVHHLGTNFRRAPDQVSRYCRQFGAIQVTDSIDLMRGGVDWLPVPADLDTIAALRAAYRDTGRIRIAHAPTNRAVKSTDTIVAAVESLAREYPIDFDVIEGVTNRECLKRKAVADIFVDQLKLGFGLNFIECAAMGIPVVSGWEDPEHRLRCRELWGQVPWIEASPESLESVLAVLIEDADGRVLMGEAGREHVTRWHSEEAVVRQTLAVYDA